MIYQFRSGSRFPVAAQVAGEALETLRDEHGGSLTPAQVVEASRPVESPLHKCFEWADRKAADRWREHQARNLIAAVVEVHVEPQTRKQTEVIAYVSVKPSGADHRSYHPTSKVVSDAELHRQAVDEALGLLTGVKRRFAHLKELESVFAAIEAAALAIEAERSKPKKVGKPTPKAKPASRKPALASSRS